MPHHGEKWRFLIMPSSQLPLCVRALASDAPLGLLGLFILIASVLGFFRSVNTAVNTYLLMTYSSSHFIWPAEYWLFNASDFFHLSLWSFELKPLWRFSIFLSLTVANPMGNWKCLCYFGLSKSVLSSTSQANDSQRDNKFGTKTLKWYWNKSHWYMTIEIHI